MNKVKEIQEYEDLFKDIRHRRSWLLWHNKKFRKEFENLVSVTKIELRKVTPTYSRFAIDIKELLPGYDHPQWKEFYAKYGIGKYWQDGQVIDRIGERPLGIKRR